MRKRIMLPKLLFLPLIALAMVSQHVYPDRGFAEQLLEMSGFVLLVACAMGRVWCAAYISGKKNKELVTGGPYSLVRNPLYFFSLLGFIGAGLVFESVTFAALLAALFFVTHWPTILHEERKLKATFGAPFDAYANSVPRLIPHSWKLRGPDIVQFTSSLYTRAVLDSSLVLSAFVFARTVEWGQISGVLPVLVHLP